MIMILKIMIEQLNIYWPGNKIGLGREDVISFWGFFERRIIRGKI